VAELMTTALAKAELKLAPDPEPEVILKPEPEPEVSPERKKRHLGRITVGLFPALGRITVGLLLYAMAFALVIGSLSVSVLYAGMVSLGGANTITLSRQRRSLA
jgi:hypothetical protein